MNIVEAAGKRVIIALDNSDGDACRHFTKDGPVELWLTAHEHPADDAGIVGRQMIVLTVALPNYPLARRHAKRLELCTGALEAAIADAQIDADAPIPTVDDGHRHVVRFARYSRALPIVAMCEVCMAELVADVREWATSRGVIPAGLPHLSVIERRGTVKDAIERAFNRDGSL